MTSEIQRGRFFVAAAILYTFIVSAALDLWTGHFSLVSWLLTAALYYALWRGQRWARWLMVGLWGMAPLVVFWSPRGGPDLFFLALTVCYVTGAALLAFPPSIAVFMAHQRTRPLVSFPPAPPREPQKHVDPY